MVGLRASEVREKVKVVAIDVWGDGSAILNVGYRPGVYTRTFEERLQKAGTDLLRVAERLDKAEKDVAYALVDTSETDDEEIENPDPVKERDQLRQELETKKGELEEKHDTSVKTVLAHWDYLGDDDEPLPISGQTLTEQMPSWLVEKMWDSIREDQQIPKAKPKPSSKRS